MVERAGSAFGIFPSLPARACDRLIPQILRWSLNVLRLIYNDIYTRRDAIFRFCLWRGFGAQGGGLLGDSCGEAGN